MTFDYIWKLFKGLEGKNPKKRGFLLSPVHIPSNKKDWVFFKWDVKDGVLRGSRKIEIIGSINDQRRPQSMSRHFTPEAVDTVLNFGGWYQLIFVRIGGYRHYLPVSFKIDYVILFTPSIIILTKA